MEELLRIQKEIQEKKGKEWLGIQPATEKNLDNFVWYLGHPKLKESPKLSKELIELYIDAKASGFMKMESINRKLDQLKIQLRDVTPFEVKTATRTMAKIPQKRVEVVNIAKEIENLKKRVEESIKRPSGINLTAGPQESLNLFLKYMNKPILQNKKKLVEEMLYIYNIAEENDFSNMQEINDLLKKIDVKLESKIVKTGKGGESSRCQWALESLQKKLGKVDETFKEIIMALKCMPIQYRAALEGELYKLSIDEENVDVLKKKVSITASFLRILSEIDPKKIIACLKPSKYISVLDMLKHIINQPKAGVFPVLDSRDKFMLYFFPEKELEEFEDIQTISILEKHFDKPLDLPGAQEILDLWDGIANFTMLVKSLLIEYAEDPSSKAILIKIGDILKSLSYGDQITIFNRALSTAAREKDKDEIVRILGDIKNHIQKDLIDKIKIDIIPKLAKAGVGGQVFTLQENSIKKVGIDISLLKWEKSIGNEKGDKGPEVNWEFHYGKEQEMLREFNSAMKKIRKYLEMKADEESSSKEQVGDRIQILSKFFKNFEWRWKRGRTRSELPLLNAVGALILEKVTEAKGYFDELIKELIIISGKSQQRVIEIPIVSGLKSEEHSTTKPVRKFIKNMGKVKDELTQLNTLNEIISKLSGNMRLVHKNLPYEFIQNQEFLKEPDKFLDHLNKYEDKIKGQKISSTILEQVYNEKVTTISRIREIIREHKNFIKNYSVRMKLLYE